MAASELRLTLDSDPEAVPALQAQLTALCSEAGFDDLGAFQLTCAIVEAVNNCIEHAYGGRPGQPIALHWLRTRNGIAVEIRDRGTAMEPLPPEEPVAHADALSGRGWHIIRQWTDTVTYRREGEENVLTLTRRP